MTVWIGVDLDGTLAMYDGWRYPSHIGEPVPAMLDRVRRWLDNGIKVKIVTARMSNHEQAREFLPAWEIWSQRHLGQVLEATCCKDFAMVELWDDRAVRVEHNTGRPLSPCSPSTSSVGMRPILRDEG